MRDCSSTDRVAIPRPWRVSRPSIAEDPQFALAYSKLGQTYADLGYDEEAETASRTAVELSAGLSPREGYLISALHAWILNDLDRAIAAYESLESLTPYDLEINMSMAGLYEDTGDFDRARAHLETVLHDDPNYVDALYALGRVEIRSGKCPAGARSPEPGTRSDQP